MNLASKVNKGTKDMWLWSGICLVCMRPWVQSPALKEKKKKRSINTEYNGKTTSAKPEEKKRIRANSWKELDIKEVLRQEGI